MTIRMPEIRLLHVTIVALCALLLVKSAAIVRAAVPASAPIPAAESAPVQKPVAIAPKPAEASKVTPPIAADVPAKPATPVTVSNEPPPVSDAERTLLLDLRQRRQELESREASLATRENVLSSAEKRLAARLDELTALQRRLEGLENARKDREESSWTGLVKVYEGMKPREAAVIFNDLDMPVLLQVLDRMKEGKAAPVLAAMQPERARQVTSQLADLRSRRHAVPPAAEPAPKAGS